MIRRLSPASRTCASSAEKVILVPHNNPPATPMVHWFFLLRRAPSGPPSSRDFGTVCACAGIWRPMLTRKTEKMSATMLVKRGLRSQTSPEFRVRIPLPPPTKHFGDGGAALGQNCGDKSHLLLEN